MDKRSGGYGKRPMRRGSGGPGGNSGNGGRGRGPDGPAEGSLTRRPRRKKVCVFCVDKRLPDYKDIGGMQRFVSDRGRIYPRNQSGCCAQHQRAVGTAVKRSREIGFLPYVIE